MEISSDVPPRKPPLPIMAVYTHLSRSQLTSYAKRFRLGTLREAHGVGAGTINTIYDLRTDRGRFFLRVLENRPARDADYEAALLTHLEARGVPVPRLMSTSSGALRLSLSPRQHVSVFEFMPGRELSAGEVSPTHAARIGAFLAQLHLAAADFPRQRRNAFDASHLRRLVQRSQGAIKKAPHRFTAEQQRDLTRMAGVLEASAPIMARDLPSGVIHGDLFTDNAKFIKDRLRGVIDFEMASSGPWAYDLAVALCEWAYLAPDFVPARAHALLSAYVQQRPLRKQERQALPALLRYAAVRFALTRFYDFEVCVFDDAHRKVKDYREYTARLDAERRFRPWLREMLNGLPVAAL